MEKESESRRHKPEPAAVQYMVACSTTELNQCTDLSNL